MDTPLMISLTGLVLFSLGTVFVMAATESLAFAIGGSMGLVIVVPFILYGLSCLQPGGCNIYAWMYAIITVIAGILVLVQAIFPTKDEVSKPPKK